VRERISDGSNMQIKQRRAGPTSTKRTSSRPAGDDAERGETRVAIVALPNFTLLLLGCIVEPLRLANRLAGRCVYRWQVIGLDRTILASSNVTVGADATIADVVGTEVDVVIVCGGVDGHLQNDKRLAAWLRALNLRGAILSAVSTGVWPLARTGLLDGCRCAVHWEEIPSFAATFPLIDVERSIFVHDGRRLTCSGGAAVIDMILHLITLQHHKSFADDVSDLIIYPGVRTAEDRQRRIERNEGTSFGALRRTIALMESHVETTTTINHIAATVGRSPRQLERLFDGAFKMSPKRYYSLLRLKRARKLLTETQLPVSEIAVRCGYLSQTQFSAQFKKAFAKPPRQYRRELQL